MAAVAVNANAWGDYGTDLEARSDEFFDERDLSATLDERSLLEARAKTDLTIPKKLEKGSISQQQHEDTMTYGKAALQRHDHKSGTVVNGWHNEGSQDDRNHFTIEPHDGKKGRIHVYNEHESHKGLPSKGSKGKKPKRDLEEHMFEERDFDYDSMLSERSVLEARAKYQLDIPTKMTKGGSPSAKEKPDMYEKGEQALKDRKIKAGGKVVQSWHDRGSRDKKEHFSIQPHDGSDNIHVYRDGSHHQGIPKRDLEAIDHLLDERDLDMLRFHRRNALHARAIYHEAYDRSVANAFA